MFISANIELIRKCIMSKQDLSDFKDNFGNTINLEDYENFKVLMNDIFEELDSYRRKVERIKEINDKTSYLLDMAHHGAKYGYYYGVNMNITFDDYNNRNHPLLAPYFKILANKERMLADAIRNKIQELEGQGKLPIGSKIITNDPPEFVGGEWEHTYRSKKDKKAKTSYGIKHDFTRSYLRHLKQTRSGYDKKYYPNR